MVPTEAYYQISQALLERAFPEFDALEGATREIIQIDQAFIDSSTRITGELTDLTTGPNALTGAFGDELTRTTGDLTTTTADRVTEKLALEGLQESFFGSLRRIAVDTAVRIIERAGLGAFFTALDVVQGFLDVVTDVIAVVLDALVIQAIIDMVTEFIQIAQQHWQQWEAELETIIKKLDGEASRPIHMPRMMSEADKVKKLREDFSSAADQAYIDALLKEGLTADQIRAILEKAAKDGSQYRYDPKQIKYLLGLGVTTDQIVQMVTLGFTETAIDTLVKLSQGPNARIAEADIPRVITGIINDLTYVNTLPATSPVQARANQQVQDGHHLQGQTALDILNGGIVQFQNYEEPHTPPGEYEFPHDIVTNEALIETTVSDKGKADQILKYLQTNPDPTTDPGGKPKPIILVAPNYASGATKELLRQANLDANNPHHVKVYVVRDGYDPLTNRPNGKSYQENLQELLKYISTGSP